MSDEKKIQTVTETDVQETNHVSRRRVFALVAGAVAGGTALLVGASALATKAPEIRGCTDNDRGQNADPPGNGRGNGRSDNDEGQNSDPAGCARH